jgi:hypothetical protein
MFTEMENPDRHKNIGTKIIKKLLKGVPFNIWYELDELLLKDNYNVLNYTLSLKIKKELIKTERSVLIDQYYFMKTKPEINNKSLFI